MNRGDIQARKEGYELDIGNVVNHVNAATLILLIREVPDRVIKIIEINGESHTSWQNLTYKLHIII